MSDAKCSRCNGDTVIGGFLPAPCPLCRPDHCEPIDAIRADRDRLAAEVERLRMVEQERDQWREAWIADSIRAGARRKEQGK